MADAPGPYCAPALFLFTVSSIGRLFAGRRFFAFDLCLGTGDQPPCFPQFVRLSLFEFSRLMVTLPGRGLIYFFSPCNSLLPLVAQVRSFTTSAVPYRPLSLLLCRGCMNGTIFITSLGLRARSTSRDPGSFLIRSVSLK